MMKKDKLLILGAGAWGSALALVAATKPVEILLWDHDPDFIKTLVQTRANERYLPGIAFPPNIRFVSELGLGMMEASDVLVVVPSHAVREIFLQLQPFWESAQGLSLASKGLDAVHLQFFHQTAQDILGKECLFGVLSGPSFAKEVAQQLPTALTYASHSPLLIDRMIPRLAQPAFRIYQNDDVIGVELGGIMKNVIAIAAGISDGLALGANARSALITRGLAEMSRLGHALGAKVATLTGLSGVGDLILTCTDDQSRNRRFGKCIASNMTAKQAIEHLGCLVEGWHNVKHLCDFAKQHHVTLPITQEVHQILYHHKPPRESLLQLLARELKAE